jgi:IPT/TIG domain
VKIAAVFLSGCAVLGLAFALADDNKPEILRISPTSGPEGTRVEIVGKNLQQITKVLFGTSSSQYKLVSADKLICIVPHHTSTSEITVLTSKTRASSPFPFSVVNDPRIPEEVSYKAGYVSSEPAPPGFTSVMLSGIAIADTRVAGYESAKVEVRRMQLSCRVDDRELPLIDDMAKLHGGLYLRSPWFARNQSEVMPTAYDEVAHAVIMPVGQRSDRAWHFWSASPRPTLPNANLEGCTAKATVKISQGALVQIGMDYWRNATVPYAPGNNHEAGASNWYFPSDGWQEAFFTDIGAPSF